MGCARLALPMYDGKYKETPPTLPKTYRITAVTTQVSCRAGASTINGDVGMLIVAANGTVVGPQSVIDSHQEEVG